MKVLCKSLRTEYIATSLRAKPTRLGAKTAAQVSVEFLGFR